MSVEIMSVSFDILDNGISAINICSEMSIPVSQIVFCRSFISYYDNDLRFKISNLSTNTISFKWYDGNENILELYYKKEFVGYVLVGDMYNVIIKCYQTLQELKK